MAAQHSWAMRTKARSLRPTALARRSTCPQAALGPPTSEGLSQLIREATARRWSSLVPLRTRVMAAVSGCAAVVVREAFVPDLDIPDQRFRPALRVMGVTAHPGVPARSSLRPLAPDGK